jgi:dihydroorotate dehydrogenase (NAD+) catalytic subunit
MEKLLEIRVGNVKLNSPLILASGTFGFEQLSFLKSRLIGALTTKTITPKPCQGNPPPRLVETPSGLLNSIGLQNSGLEGFLQDELPKFVSSGFPFIISIGGFNFEDYLLMVKALDKKKEGYLALEVNVSCPNVKQGGLSFGRKPETVYSLVSMLRKATKLPLWVKLSPLTQVVELAIAAQEAGADALVVGNTLPGLAVDVEKGSLALGAQTGGLSGPAIRPVALRAAYEVVQTASLPVVGCGGIFNYRNALEFLMVGCQAVSIGTVNLVDPSAPVKIAQGLADFLKTRGFNSINQIIGLVK